MRLDERHRRDDAAEQLLVGAAAGGRAGGRERAGAGARRSFRRRRAVPRKLEQAREAGLRREGRGGVALEEVAPLLRYRAGVVEVLLEQKRCVAGVRAVDLRVSHSRSVVERNERQSGCYQIAWPVDTASENPRKKQTAPKITAAS